MKIEQIAASRCPVCRFVAAPPARWCPRHPVEMVRTSVIGAGFLHHAPLAAPGLPFTPSHRAGRAERRRPLRLPRRRDARAADRLAGGHRGRGRRLLLLAPQLDRPRAALLEPRRPRRRAPERDRAQRGQARLEGTITWRKLKGPAGRRSACAVAACASWRRTSGCCGTTTGVLVGLAGHARERHGRRELFGGGVGRQAAVPAPALGQASRRRADGPCWERTWRRGRGSVAEAGRQRREPVGLARSSHKGQDGLVATHAADVGSARYSAGLRIPSAE